MKLLFVLDSFGSGGAQRQMVNLALGLHRRGHRIEFFVYFPQYRDFAEPVEKAGIPIHVYQKIHRYSISVILHLRRQIGKGGYDGILSFLDTPNIYAELSRIGIGNVPLVVSERYMYSSETLPIAKIAFQQLHRLAERITVNSHHQRERMERMFPWMRDKICTIYNGVDLSVFSPGTSRIREKSRPLELLAVGTIVPKKNLLGLVRAISIFRSRHGEVPTIRWVGRRDPTKLAGETFETVARELDDLMIKDRWEWLGERHDIPELLRHHDALIHPSFFEGLPNAICEALACGKPVLASRVCDHPILVQEGKTGFLFDPRDPVDIAASIHKLCKMENGQFEEMCRQARLFAERELSLEAYVMRYEELFAEMSG